MRYYVGLDIGGTKCAILLAKVDRGIQLLDKIRFLTQTERGFEDAYGRLCAGVEEILARNGLTEKDMAAIGVSCGGPLDSRNGVVLCPPNLPGWVDIPLARMLTERFHVPAFLQNDANACALVEWKLGAGRGCENMIFLTMGTGMGGGVIAENRLIRGCTDMGGEIGHLRLTENGPVGFGKAGSFEGYTSGGGIGRQAAALTQELTAQGKAPAWKRAGHDAPDAKIMAEYARAGDADAKAFFDHIGDMLGRGVALLVDAFNPEKIIIGSIFVRCEDLLRPAMEAALQREAIPQALAGVRVCPAETGEQLGDLASIMTALYALGVDPLSPGESEEVQAHLTRLLARYPVLEACREQMENAYALLENAFAQGHKLLLCGNGGSCADCEHIVGELMKGFRLKRPLDAATRDKLQAALGDMGDASLLQGSLPAVSLCGLPALTTAFQNDVEPFLNFTQQVLGLGQPGDVVMGISTSGNSKNVVMALRAAQAMGMKTLGLTGGNGGRMRDCCDALVIVPAKETADIQELHLPVYHALCSMLESRFFAEKEENTQ